MTADRDIVDQWLAAVAEKSRGRTRYAGQEPYWDEVVAAEIERLRAQVEDECRLNGMGAEREAKLIAGNDRLKRRVTELEDLLRNYVP